MSQTHRREPDPGFRSRELEPGSRTQLRRHAEMLFGDLPDGVMVQQLGRIVYANDGYLDLLGCESMHELVGGPVMELYRESEWPDLLQRLQATAFSGRPGEPGRYHLRRRDGGGEVAVEVALILLPMDGAAPLVVEVARRL